MLHCDLFLILRIKGTISSECILPLYKGSKCSDDIMSEELLALRTFGIMRATDNDKHANTELPGASTRLQILSSHREQYSAIEIFFSSHLQHRVSISNSNAKPPTP
jgi:hypothetical protein